MISTTPDMLDAPNITPRERDVLQILHSGVARTNKEYGALLHVSSKTIEAALSNLYRKFGVSCLAHLLLKTTPSSTQPQSLEPTLRIGDIRYFNGKALRVSAYRADSAGYPCIVFESGSETLIVPITASVALDAITNTG